MSEALHAGRPVIVSNIGGIPLQVKDKVNGFLVKPGDFKMVAAHLLELFTDDELHKKMSHAARTVVSDEAGSPSATPSDGFISLPRGRGWALRKAARAGSRATRGGSTIWLREDADYPYAEGENWLPRHFTQQKKTPRIFLSDLRVARCWFPGVHRRTVVRICA